MGRRSRSKVRDAYGLEGPGGIAVFPDEVVQLLDAAGLSAAERLTVLAILAGVRPGGSVVVARSIRQIQAWTGASRGYASETIRRVVEGFDPPILGVVDRPTARSSRGFDVRPLLVALRRFVATGSVPARVRPAEHQGSPGRTPSAGGPNSRVRPAELQSSAREPATDGQIPEEQRETNADGAPSGYEGFRAAAARLGLNRGQERRQG